MGSQKAPSAAPQPAHDDRLLQELMTRIAGLEEEVDRLKRQFGENFKLLQDGLNLKLDRSELEAFEQTIMLRINDIVAALTNRFADKAETKKALKLLERQLKNLYDLFMSKGQGSNEEDAMFSKKGYSCASCEKDLINLYGKKVDFMPWGKLPFRDPTERIARVGQGFSKMLSMINPDQMSGMTRGMSQEPVSQTAQGFYQPGAEGVDGTYTEMKMPMSNNGRHSVQVVNKLGGEHMNERPGSGHRRKMNTRISNRFKK